MNSGAFDCRSDSRESTRNEGQRSLECKWTQGLLGREKGQGNPWYVAFFTSKARPKGGIDKPFDGCGIRHRRQVRLTAKTTLLMAMRRVGVQSRGDSVRGGVSLTAHGEIIPYCHKENESSSRAPTACLLGRPDSLFLPFSRLCQPRWSPPINASASAGPSVPAA